MRKPITLFVTLSIALLLSTCSNSGDMPYSSTTSPRSSVTASSQRSPATTSLSAAIKHDVGILQEDASPAQVENENRSLPQCYEAASESSLQRSADHAISEIIEIDSLEIIAATAYVLNIDTDSALYRKNSDGHIAPASTAKMLTALTVLDYYSPDDILTVGAEIDLIAADSSTAWLSRGDTLSVKQLLVALLLPSGNDAAYTLAVNTGKAIAGGQSLSLRQATEIFIDAMNHKAHQVGAVSSNFASPDGCDATGQYTTAIDLAQIAKACINDQVLSELMSSYRISDTWANGREVTYRNTNELLNPDSQYYYPNAIGLKTGTTIDAGSCLVSAAVINGNTYICVIMGSSADARYSDSLAIFNEIA